MAIDAGAIVDSPENLEAYYTLSHNELKSIMNIAVDKAKGSPYGYTDGLGSVFIDGNPDCDIPLYLIQELDN